VYVIESGAKKSAKIPRRKQQKKTKKLFGGMVEVRAE
jgi:hypothetical protein